MDALADHSEGLPTRRQHFDRWATRQDDVQQIGYRTWHVLAVVDDHEQAAPLEPVDDRVDERETFLRTNPQCRRERVSDCILVRHRRQFDHPHAGVELFEARPAQLDRHSGLADSTGTGQGE